MSGWEIINRANQECHKGRGWDSIARRIWGRRAEVRQGQRVGDGVRDGMIVKPARVVRGANQNSYDVLARVLLREPTKREG